MIVCTLGSLLAIPVHVVPAELTDDMFEFAGLSLEAESHIKIGAAFIHVSIGTMLPPLAFLFHEIWANFEVMAKVALVSIPTLTQTLKLVTRFDFAFVMRMRAVVGEPALAVDKLLADSVGGEFVVVGGGRSGLEIRSFVGGIVGAGIGWNVVLRVHLKFNMNNKAGLFRWIFKPKEPNYKES